MLSCSIWFSVPSFWMGGGLESRCVGRVYGADGAVHHPHRTAPHIQCSWWWAYAPETCWAKNTSIKLPSCIKLAFHFKSCFGWFLHPSSGAQITVFTASGRSLNSSLLAPGSNNGWLVPDTVDTAVCVPDDGWRNHPKHVEQFTDKINCV